MQYIIDGHNVIGQCRTIRLSDPDDEARLVDLLHRWLMRYPQHQVTVVFDGGVYGHPHQLKRAGIRVIFAHSPQDADARLMSLIARITTPRQYRLVTSDRAIISAAESHKIEIIRSAEFAAQIEQPRSTPRRTSRRSRPEPKLPASDVDHWLREFGADDELPDSPVED